MTLIESAQQNTRTYNPTDFAYTQVTLKLGRHQRITDVTLMLNNECATDCIYCYANKAKKVLPMPLNKVLSLIDEAKKLELRSFDVIGGDIFVYPHWKVVIKKLYDNGFLPFVSTKVPIKKADIAYLKSIGIKDIQVSLDTLIPEHLHAIVRTNANYCEQIKQTLQELSRNNIEVIIHTIVCSQNCTIEDMKSLYHFIQELPLISKWRIDIANYSLYKTEKEFHQYRATASEVQVLYRYLRELKPDKLTIMCGGIDMENSMQKRPDPNFLTHNRIICTANYSGLFVLPDGLVTICEQLYWNPNFIVGDVKMQSLIDIWNSSKAYDLFVLKQCNLRGDSACKKCDKFVFCRQENGGVCWRDVMATFGACNWDFPDPRCDKAPTALYQVTVV